MHINTTPHVIRDAEKRNFFFISFHFIRFSSFSFPRVQTKASDLIQTINIRVALWCAQHYLLRMCLLGEIDCAWRDTPQSLNLKIKICCVAHAVYT